MYVLKSITLVLMLMTLQWGWTAEISQGLGLEVSTVKTTPSLTAAAPIEHLRWSGIPIPLALPVGVDRVVGFPQEVRVGPPGKLTEVLHTTSADGAVYFRALAPFEPTLVFVQETEPPGRTFAFQLRAEEKASAAPVEILAPGEKTAAPPTEEAQVSSAEIMESPLPKRYGYVALTRFAAQQLYAPERLLQELEGVYRVPLSLRRAVPLIRTAATLAEIEATPLASWASDEGIYVTAVRLRNHSPHAVILDPRNSLRGQWLAATFQHARLLPSGHEADTTAVYLISAQPFVESLGFWGRRR